MTSTSTISDRLLSAALALQGLPEQASGSHVSPQEMASVLKNFRALERRCTAVGAALADAAQTHQEEGIGGPVEDVLSRGDEVARSQARTEAARVGVHRRFPLVRAAVWAGSARTANVDVLARLLSHMTAAEVAELAKSDHEIAKAAQRLNSDSFGRHIRRARDSIRQDHGADAEARARRASQASVTPNGDRSGYRVWAELATEDGAAFADAFNRSLSEISRTLGDGHGLSPQELSVRALVEPFIRGMNTTPTFENSRVTVQMGILADLETLRNGPHENTVAETFDGQPLAPTTLSRLGCDAVVRRVETLPDGKVNVSVASRTASDSQRLALRALYPGCAVTGAPWSQCEIHHVVFSSAGGPTSLANLIPVSRRWHHLIHDEGYRLTLAMDRTLTIANPDGSIYTVADPPIPVTISPTSSSLNQPMAA